jgi:DNA-binding transcriptional MerR regulator
MADHEQLLTAHEVGVLLRLTPRTVRIWSHRGLLTPALRMGQGRRELRWRLSDIQRFMADAGDGPVGMV